MWADDFERHGDVCFERGCDGRCAVWRASLTAMAEGGAQRWLAGADAEMMLTGPAEIICTGGRRWSFE
jgi:hypothetical protein